jgi:hypothetical protein
VRVHYDHQFGLFQDGPEGPLWRASFADIDQAKRHAQVYADEEGREFFVYSYKDYSEVARLFPSRRPARVDKLSDAEVLSPKRVIQPGTPKEAK